MRGYHLAVLLAAMRGGGPKSSRVGARCCAACVQGRDHVVCVVSARHLRGMDRLIVRMINGLRILPARAGARLGARLRIGSKRAHKRATGMWCRVEYRS